MASRKDKVKEKINPKVERKEVDGRVVIKYRSYKKIDCTTFSATFPGKPYLFKPLKQLFIYDDYWKRDVIDLTEIQQQSYFPYFTQEEVDLALYLIHLRWHDGSGNNAEFLASNIKSKIDFLNKSFIPVFSLLYFLSEIPAIDYLLYYLNK